MVTMMTGRLLLVCFLCVVCCCSGGSHALTHEGDYFCNQQNWTVLKDTFRGINVTDANVSMFCNHNKTFVDEIKKTVQQTTPVTGASQTTQTPASAPDGQGATSVGGTPEAGQASQPSAGEASTDQQTQNAAVGTDDASQPVAAGTPVNPSGTAEQGTTEASGEQQSSCPTEVGATTPEVAGESKGTAGDGGLTAENSQATQNTSTNREEQPSAASAGADANSSTGEDSVDKTRQSATVITTPKGTNNTATPGDRDSSSGTASPLTAILVLLFASAYSFLGMLAQ